YTPNERWRLSWNADGVVAPSGSWRTGAYMKFIYRPASPIIVVRPAGSGTASSAPRVTITDYPLLNVYAQAISLNTLTVEAGNTPFSEKQTIVEANVIFPIAPLRPLRAALVGTVNGRWLTVRDTTNGTSQQPSFAQFGEG